MIISIKIHHCPKCDSPNIIKNGCDYKKAQKYHCKDCRAYGTLLASRPYANVYKDLILRAYRERASMRGIRRIFGIVRQTLARWLKEKAAVLPDLADTLAAPQADDVLELDELGSFVLKKSEKRWIWLTLCRRTRQVVAWYIGDRSKKSCRELWQRIPDAYKAS